MSPLKANTKEKKETYNLLAGVDSVDAKGQGIVFLLLTLGDLKSGGFKARGEDKHVLELSLVHVLGESDDKNGRDLFRGRIVAVVGAGKTLGSEAESAESAAQGANVDRVGGGEVGFGNT